MGHRWMDLSPIVLPMPGKQTAYCWCASWSQITTAEMVILRHTSVLFHSQRYPLVDHSLIALLLPEAHHSSLSLLPLPTLYPLVNVVLFS